MSASGYLELTVQQQANDKKQTIKFRLLDLSSISPFPSTHQHFLSDNAVYFVVENLSLKTSPSSRFGFLFNSLTLSPSVTEWITSLNRFAPHSIVFVVGVHSGDISTEKKQEMLGLSSRFVFAREFSRK